MGKLGYIFTQELMCLCYFCCHAREEVSASQLTIKAHSLSATRVEGNDRLRRCDIVRESRMSVQETKTFKQSRQMAAAESLVTDVLAQVASLKWDFERNSA